MEEFWFAPNRPARFLAITIGIVVASIAWFNPLVAQATSLVHSGVLPQHNGLEVVRTSSVFDLQQGSAAMAREDYMNALPHLQRSIEKNPLNVLALYDMAACYEALAEQTKERTQKRKLLALAEGYYLRVAAASPELTVTYYKLGRLANQRGDRRRAKEYYQQGVAVEPNNHVLHFNLAVLYDQTDELQQAIHHYQQSLKIQPKLVYAYNNLGLLYERVGKLREAEQSYRSALSIQRGYNFARLNLANLYAHQNQWDRALSMYQDAVKIEPTNAWAHLYLGNAYFRKGLYAEAARCYQASIENNESYGTTYYLLAVSLYRIDRLEEAAAAGLQYLSREPNGEHQAEMKQLLRTVRVKPGTP
ncbi:MAG: tetratricopeptide repeat protein [Candidatus Melainabacteria bacterium]|nr:tetratricopeptide repeat protein [Candidatus Melainabacteria bacterium]